MSIKLGYSEYQYASEILVKVTTVNGKRGNHSFEAYIFLMQRNLVTPDYLMIVYFEFIWLG
jgi:hypothetical protein